MKIMLIIPNLCLGGAETMCENLANALKDKGQNVVLVSLFTEKTPITERLQKKGFKIHFLNKKLGFDWKMFRAIAKVIKQERPDVVHTHLSSAMYTFPATALYGVKGRIHTVHNIAAKDGNMIAQKILYPFYFRCLGVIPVALSEEIKKTILELYKLPAEIVPDIFNGIDLSKCVEKTDYSIENIPKVLNIASFKDQKNHFTIIEAISELKHLNIRFLFIGEGELLQEVKDLAKQLSVEDKIDFLGAQSNVYPFLHEADVFMLPSKYEGVPMTLIEAMGTALPIIASAVGGVPDMLTDNESALLIKPTKEDIVAAVNRMISDESLRQRLGKAAKQRSVQFSSDIMAEKYLEIYCRESKVYRKD